MNVLEILGLVMFFGVLLIAVETFTGSTIATTIGKKIYGRKVPIPVFESEK